MRTKEMCLRGIIITVFLLSASANSHAMFDDDPWLSKFASEFEYLKEDSENVIEWDIDFWYGRDLNKFWIKSQGEYSDSEFESANIEFVYSRAVYTTWDQQFGIRHDIEPSPQGNARNWLSFGYIGTAPYFVGVDARIFVGEESSTQLLVELEKEIMLSQNWVLTPELDIIANGRTNRVFAEGSGLAEMELSLRLGYEHNGNRKLQPFIGLGLSQTFGATKRLQKALGNNSGEFQAMLGFHSWF